VSLGKLPEVVLSVLTVVSTGKWTPTSAVSDERTAMVSDTCIKQHESTLHEREGAILRKTKLVTQTGTAVGYSTIPIGYC
jgi:hypothetical protein